MFHTATFKQLAHNDTARAVGHQGGFVVPKSLSAYFPTLDESLATPAHPTVEAPITAEIVVDGKVVTKVPTRYQYQTWGAERSPERRVTGNLASFRSVAKRDDYLVMQRTVANPSAYRFTLVKSGTVLHNAIAARVGSPRWGQLDVTGLGGLF